MSQPDEHKFAVYTPLFAPVAVPIVLGLIKEILGWRRRRRARRAAEAAPPTTEVAADEVEVKKAIIPDLSREEVFVVEAPEAVARESPPKRALRSRKKILE